jgi:kynureninase
MPEPGSLFAERLREMTEMDFQLGSEFARHLDAEDELALFRNAFVASDPGLIYLDGNSLGRLPLTTVERVQSLVGEEWGDGLIRPAVGCRIGPGSRERFDVGQPV